jgi:hypothetical protein
MPVIMQKPLTLFHENVWLALNKGISNKQFVDLNLGVQDLPENKYIENRESSLSVKSKRSRILIQYH